MNLLHKFEVEIFLIWKVSFKEKADIYNEVHGCVRDHYDDSEERGGKRKRDRSTRISFFRVCLRHFLE